MREDAEPTFRKDRYRWIKQRTQIDLTNIDEDISEMPTLIQDCGECCALAIEIRDSAEEDLTNTKAVVAEGMRKTLTNGKAPSEAAITSMIPLSQEFRDKQAAYSVARLDAALWQSLMAAIQSKNYSIRTAADLVTSGFITTDYIRDKRRQQIRNVKPAAVSADVTS